MTSHFQNYYREDDSTFSKPEQPTLILWANRDISHDTTHLIKSSSFFAKIFYKFLINEVQSDKKGLIKYVPHALFKEIEGTGHHLELENPEGVCGEIKNFVGADLSVH